MLFDESKWDEDLLLNADERDELEEIARAWESDEMITDFNRAIDETATLPVVAMSIVP